MFLLASLAESNSDIVKPLIVFSTCLGNLSVKTVSPLLFTLEVRIVLPYKVLVGCIGVRNSRDEGPELTVETTFFLYSASYCTCVCRYVKACL